MFFGLPSCKYYPCLNQRTHTPSESVHRDRQEQILQEMLYEGEHPASSHGPSMSPNQYLPRMYCVPTLNAGHHWLEQSGGNNELGILNRRPQILRSVYAQLQGCAKPYWDLRHKENSVITVHAFIKNVDILFILTSVLILSF